MLCQTIIDHDGSDQYLIFLKFCTSVKLPNVRAQAHFEVSLTSGCLVVGLYSSGLEAELETFKSPYIFLWPYFFFIFLIITGFFHFYI